MYSAVLLSHLLRVISDHKLTWVITSTGMWILFSKKKWDSLPKRQESPAQSLNQPGKVHF